MKKVLSITMLVALVAGLSIASIRSVSADDDMKNGMMGKGGMMGGDKMEMKGMMMKMMHPDIVATSDGGIVILIGTKLTKYDKNLNIVKEVDIKMPDMDEMKKMCPMMGKGMKDHDDADNTMNNAAAEKAEHESHHK